LLFDESEVTIVGTVHVTSIEISGFDPIPMTFHVLAGLPFDVIFGDEFLEDIDAFNTCCDLRMLDVDYPDFNTLINLGPLQAWIAKSMRKKKKKSLRNRERQIHEDMMDAERYHRNKIRRTNLSIEDVDQRTLAEAVETRRMREFDRGHQSCQHCRDG
jgi:hypothetical protein